LFFISALEYPNTKVQENQAGLEFSLVDENITVMKESRHALADAIKEVGLDLTHRRIHTGMHPDISSTE
jgi:hypothetical protein